MTKHTLIAGGLGLTFVISSCTSASTGPRETASSVPQSREETAASQPRTTQSSGAQGYAFLGIPEDEASREQPVGLLRGESNLFWQVSAVHETTYSEYLKDADSGRIRAQERHGGYIYFAVEERRCVHSNDMSGMVRILDRKKTKQP